MDPLVCDLYEFDLGGRPDVGKLAAAGPPWAGLILKATEGTRYQAGTWLEHALVPARHAGLRVGTYLYAHFNQSGWDQAQAYIRRMQHLIQPGDLPPTIDVERAGNTFRSAADVVQTVRGIAEALTDAYGVAPTLYGGELIRSLGIRDHMGCGRLWVARYTATLPMQVYKNMGWDYPFMWQYDGDGESHLAHYPQVSPMGRCDISAVTDHGEWDKARIP